MEKYRNAGGGVLLCAGIMPNRSTELYFLVSCTVIAQLYRDDVLDHPCYCDDAQCVHHLFSCIITKDVIETTSRMSNACWATTVHRWTCVWCFVKLSYNQILVYARPLYCSSIWIGTYSSWPHQRYDYKQCRAEHKYFYWWHIKANNSSYNMT